MKKRIVAVMLILAFVMSGCALVDRFEEAKAAYLETRVEELMGDDVVEVVEPETAAAELEVEVEVEEPEVEEEAAETPEPVEDAESKEAQATEEVEEAAETEEAETESEVEVEDAEMESEEEVQEVIESDDPGVYLGDADWLDDMEVNDNPWTLVPNEYTTANYEDGTLEIKAVSKTHGWRLAPTPVLEDAYMEAIVTMGDCKSTDGYGMIFKVPENVDFNRGYFFEITCGGQYSLRIWDGLAGETGTSKWLRYRKASEYIIPGQDATNILGVMTVGDMIELYINGELVDSFEDATYRKGFFGLFINRDYTENLTINVDQVSYWMDPLE